MVHLFTKGKNVSMIILSESNPKKFRFVLAMLGEFRRHIYKYTLDLLHSKAKHSIGTTCIHVYTAN